MEQVHGRICLRGLGSMLVVFALLVSLVGSPAVVSSVQAASGSAVIGPSLVSALNSGVGPFEVIVTFHGVTAPTATDVAALNLSGITRGKLFQALPMAGVVATSDQVRALAARPEVRSLWLNETLQYDNADGTVLTGVDRVRADAEMTRRNSGVPVAGTGVTVLVNDSGVDGLHSDIDPNIIQNVFGGVNLADESPLLPVTYVEGVDNTDVGGGHGTHVASIVGGTGARSNGLYEGVAPKANIVAFGSGAGLLLLNTLGGFDYAKANRERYNIRVITNSWGSTSDKGDFNPDHPTNVASKLLNDQGVVVVFSAGNSGPAAGTISGNYKKAPWVITVAAADKNRALASFSSRGVKDKTVTVTSQSGETFVSEDRPTVTAPGVNIVSTRASGSSLSPLAAQKDAALAPEHLPYYTTLSGTSMAAPHVAGIVALLFDANPNLTPAQVKAIIEGTADMMSGYEAWEVGAGFVNAYDAVTEAFALTAEPTGTSPRKIKKCNHKNPCTPPPAPRVTVSVIDSAINPYHEFFNVGGEPYALQAPSSVTPEVLTAFGIDESHILDLTRTGNFAADYAADKATIWDRVQPGELYWFRGTNIIAVSYDGGTRPILPDDSADTHGVGTAAAVVRANPDAIILFVEGITDEAETFAFNHPQIDIVSTSYGPIGSIPLPYHIENSYVGVVKNGKLHFGAADNSPSTAVQDSTAGPWWSIGVAGFQEETSEGKQILSGSLADFAADFTQTLPYCFDCETGMRSVSGTSFATPRSAGTMSKVLLETRRALSHTGGITSVNSVPVMAQGQGRVVSNWQLRRALEEAAYYPTIYDYTAGGGTFDLTSAPVLDPAPWGQVGWGVITPVAEHEVIPQTLAQLGLGGDVTRTKDALACGYMTKLIEARHAYWDKVIIESESWMEMADPYIYCGR